MFSSASSKQHVWLSVTDKQPSWLLEPGQPWYATDVHGQVFSSHGHQGWWQQRRQRGGQFCWTRLFLPNEFTSLKPSYCTSKLQLRRMPACIFWHASLNYSWRVFLKGVYASIVAMVLGFTLIGKGLKLTESLLALFCKKQTVFWMHIYCFSSLRVHLDLTHLNISDRKFVVYNLQERRLIKGEGKTRL